MALASRQWPLAAARLALGLLVLVPVVAIVWWHGFAGLYGQDAFGYANYALGPLRDALVHLDLPPAWPQPPGYPIVVSAVSLPAGPDGRIGLVVSIMHAEMNARQPGFWPSGSEQMSLPLARHQHRQVGGVAPRGSQLEQQLS